MDILYKVGSAVLLLVGVLYPLGAIYMMMKFLTREGFAAPFSRVHDAPFRPDCDGAAGRDSGGFAGFAPTLWESQVIRMIVYGASVLSVVALAMLLVSSRRQPSSGE